MALFLAGINHHSAPVALRERVAIVDESLAEALSEAQHQLALPEIVILSTCNRTELICEVDEPDAQRLIAWLARYHGVALDELMPHIYQCHEYDALRHLITVACGLDSMVLGEPQVFGQIKAAFAQASESGCVGGKLARAFHYAFTVAKRVRTETAIGENPVSVAYAAVRLARHIFSNLTQISALLIGAGETIELVATHLRENGIGTISIANRSVHRAEELAERFGARGVSLIEVPQVLETSDIVISSTGSQLPILGKGAVEQAVRRRRHQPILMVDLAVPRDIEEQVTELADVYLYTIDDLEEIIEDNRRARVDAATQAAEMIEAGVAEFLRGQRGLSAVDTLRQFRTQAEALRDQELARALRQLRSGSDPEEVLTRLSRNLTGKLLHGPSVNLRQAAADGRQEVVEWAAELLQFDVGGDQ